MGAAERLGGELALLGIEVLPQGAAGYRLPVTFDGQGLDLAAQPVELELVADVEVDLADHLDG